MNQLLFEPNYFNSSDFCLCTTLCCYGYQIEAIDKQNPSKAVFVIKRDNRLDGLIQSYFTHQLTVEPLSFFNFIKELKTRIYHS
jgi:hypothetical protein